MVSDLYEFFPSIVGTPKEGAEWYNKQESLKDAVIKKSEFVRCSNTMDKLKS